MGRFLSLSLLGMVLVMLLVGLGDRTPAQSIAQTSINLESRISQLESSTYNLRSQVSQLATQVNGLGGVPRTSTTTPSTPSTRSLRTALSGDPQFDRLATLVIELKERMDAIDSRLVKVEKRLLSR